MLAFCGSPGEISLVLGSSDARWLSEEMSFLSELYRSKANGSERQFGADDNAASASFWETALKCQRLSVALQQAVSRGQRWEDNGRDQRVVALPATDPPQQALASPSSATSSGSAERQSRPKRARRTAKPRDGEEEKGSLATVFRLATFVTCGRVFHREFCCTPVSTAGNAPGGSRARLPV